MLTHAHPEFSPPRLFISYSRSDGREFAEEFERRIAAQGLTSWRDLKSVEGGEDIRAQVQLAIEDAEHLVLILTRASLESDWVKREWMHARERGVKVSPVLGDLTLRKRDLPKWAQRADVYDTTEPERWTKLVSVLKGPGATRRVTYMAGQLPASFVPRPAPFDRVKELVLTGASGAVGLSTALSGAGGYGKTTLANALCRDEDIRFEFSDGIIRVEIGKERDSVLGLVSDVIEKLDRDGRRPGFQDEMLAGEHLAEVLGEARALLVIDDVWREHQLRPFLVGGPRCVRLITTRLPRLLPATCETFDVDELLPDEATNVLTWSLPSHDVEQNRQQLEALSSRLEGWAQMLEIANGWLRERIRRGECLAAALSGFCSRLDHKGLAGFDPKSTDERNRAIALCVEVSTEDLDASERARLEELAVLPEDVDAPIDAITRLWNQTGGLDKFESEDLLDRLASLSLLQRLDLSSRTLRLHDNLKWLLRERIGPVRLAIAHSSMADSIVGAVEGIWAMLPATDPYGWRYGIQHLRAAGRHGDADALLIDYSWIKARLSVLGAGSLLEAWESPLDGRDAQEVGRAIALSLPALSKFPSQLALQLWGRLGEASTQSVADVATAARADPAFWPAPRWPSLTPPGQQMQSFIGHESAVTSAVFSPNGARVLTASEDGTARLWDLTGAETFVMRGHEGEVWRAVFSPDGTRVLTVSTDGTARLWDGMNGTAIAVLIGHEDGVWSAVFSPDGNQVLTASDDGTARLWRSTGAPISALRGHEAGVWSAVFSPDGTRALTASGDGTARLWDGMNGTSTAVLRGHKSGVTSAVFSPDGTQVLTASDDGTAGLWDAATGARTAGLRGHKGEVTSAVFSPDGTQVLTASADGTALLWDAATAAATVSLRGHKGAVVNAVFSPDGAQVLTASWDRTARLWNDAGAQIAILRGHENVLNAIFSDSGTRILTASADSTARLWNPTAGARAGAPRGHKGAVKSAVFSANGIRLLTTSEGGTARLWDTATGAEIVLPHWSRAVFSADGTCVSTATGDRSLDELSRDEAAMLIGHEGAVTSAMFSPDGTRVLTASEDQTAMLWDATSGAWIAVLHGHEGGLMSAVFSPDGTLVLTLGRDGVRLWDGVSGAATAVLLATERVVSAGFSPDGTRVLTASMDETAQLWDAATGAETTVLRGHKYSVRSAVFSPDGARVLTASGDRTARLWDAFTGAEIAVLRGHEGDVTAVFSPDGVRILTVSEGTARLWDAVTGVWIGLLGEHIQTAVFSPDGARVLTNMQSGALRLWEASAGVEIAVPGGKRYGVTSAVFLPDGKRVLTASRNRTLRLWDINSGQETAILCLDARPSTWAFYGSALAIGDQLGRINIYDLDTRQ